MTEEERYFKRREEIINHCGQCVKLNYKTLKCFALTEFYFDQKKKSCFARQNNINKWEKDLEEMIHYAKMWGNFIGGDLKEELARVKKLKEAILVSDIRRAWYEDTHRDNIKFGGSSDSERPVSIKAKMKNNKLVITHEERIREQKKLDRLCTKKIKRKK